MSRQSVDNALNKRNTKQTSR